MPRPLGEIKRLKYFVAVAEKLNFRRAAEALNLSQPPLTQQIKLLEEELGVQLFDRSQGGTTLTPAGEKLYEFASRLLYDAQRAFEEIAKFASGEAGSLKIGYTDDFLHSPLPAMLAKLCADLAGIVIHGELGGTAELTGKLRSGALDACFICPPFPEGAQPIIRTDLGEAKINAVLPCNHPLANEHELSLRSLRDEPFILPPQAEKTGYYIQLIKLFDEAGFWPHIQHTIEDAQLRQRLVAAGAGIAVESEFSISCAHNDIRKICLCDAPARISLAALFQPSETGHALEKLHGLASAYFPIHATNASIGPNQLEEAGLKDGAGEAAS